MSPEEIERRAAEMAAAVDARLSGVVATTSPQCSDNVATLACALEQYHERLAVGRGLKEDEIYEMLKDAGECEDDVFALSERWQMHPDVLRRWIFTFLNDFHNRQGWPRLLDKMEQKYGKPTLGIIFDSTVPFRKQSPRWLREWRCLWFLMQFYPDGPTCKKEWRGVDLTRGVA